MNKLTIPTILAVTILAAGIFAFSPVEEASTVHAGAGGILANNMGLVSVQAVDISNANALFSCDNDADDGVITFTLDTNTDSAELISLFIDTSIATDAGDTLTIDINTDGVEVMTATAIDDGPSGDTEFLSAFKADGTQDEVGNSGPFVFSDTITLDVNCEFDNGAFSYSFTGIFRAPGGATITPTETVV